jgi:hypothetical protein
MRIFVVPGAALLLTGCVQPAYPPPSPIELLPYPPPISYETTPSYRPPSPPPLAEPLPPPTDQTTGDQTPSDDTGPIPLQDMPSPDSTSTAPGPTQADTTAPPPTPAVPTTPTAGPGSNVPLEGFRPMHGQSRPTP